MFCKTSGLLSVLLGSAALFVTAAADAQTSQQAVFYYPEGVAQAVSQPAYATQSAYGTTNAQAVRTVEYSPNYGQRRDAAYTVAPSQTQQVRPLYGQQQDTVGAPTTGYVQRNSAITLGTRPGFDIGAQGMYYRYRESSLDVTELGGMGGVTGSGTLTFGDGYFAALEGRFVAGGTDYRGSGTSPNKFTDIGEARAAVGKDFNFADFTMSPYVGLGFRHLYNDNRGTTSTGASGYRRVNDLFYLPIGFHPRFRISEDERVTATVEYDVPLRGEQTSYLSDAGPGIPDLHNLQTSGGSGIKADIMYETSNWSAGPFFNYWDIGQSNSQAFQSNNAGYCASFGLSSPCTLNGVEPRNHTTEAGIQLRYHFF